MHVLLDVLIKSVFNLNLIEIYQMSFARGHRDVGRSTGQSHHGDSPLLKPTGMQVATKPLLDPTNGEHRKRIGFKTMSLGTNYSFYVVWSAVSISESDAFIRTLCCTLFIVVFLFHIRPMGLNVCMYVNMVITFNRVWINRVTLPILLVVS